MKTCNANGTLIFLVVIKAFENNMLWILWNENFRSGFDNVTSRCSSYIFSDYRYLKFKIFDLVIQFLIFASLYLTFFLPCGDRIDFNCRVLFGENPIPRDPKVNNAVRALRPASRLLHVVNDLGDRLRVSYGDLKRLSPLYIVEKIRC